MSWNDVHIKYEANKRFFIRSIGCHGQSEKNQIQIIEKEEERKKKRQIRKPETLDGVTELGDIIKIWIKKRNLKLKGHQNKETLKRRILDFC